MSLRYRVKGPSKLIRLPGGLASESQFARQSTSFRGLLVLFQSFPNWVQFELLGPTEAMALRSVGGSALRDRQLYAELDGCLGNGWALPQRDLLAPKSLFPLTKWPRVRQLGCEGSNILPSLFCAGPQMLQHSWQKSEMEELEDLRVCKASE